MPKYALMCLLILLSPLTSGSAELGTAWHPDPDGDGIVAGIDLCQAVYDPLQEDIDGDGIGDLCDDDFAPPVQDGAVSDLRVEHVTPYGAWFRFTSTRDTQWGWDAAVAWSLSLIHI